jgi:hypothetical protein
MLDVKTGDILSATYPPQPQSLIIFAGAMALRGCFAMLMRRRSLGDPEY